MIVNSGAISVFVTSDDFGRRKSLFINVEDQWMVPGPGYILVQPEQAPFMEWSPAILDAADLFDKMAEAVRVDAAEQLRLTHPVLVPERGSRER